MKTKSTTLPEKGDTGGVEPAGEAGADPLGLWLPPGGFTIMILRVTLTASSGKSSPYDFTLPLSDSESTKTTQRKRLHLRINI